MRRGNAAWSASQAAIGPHVTLDERSRSARDESRLRGGEARRRHLHRGGTESCDLAIAG